ncbi:MAG: 2-hydroxyacyl-CoA dehydratase [Spirochaetales bacterium]|nr:2-hydroxyacyl-CoA dehydratase [Spirochaetales bacterium]
MKTLQFGYVCNNVPVELFHCFNIELNRLFGGGSDFSSADRHFPSFCCSFVKSVFTEFKNRDDLDGIISSISCDAMMTMGDIINVNNDGRHCYTFLSPVSTTNKEAMEFYKAESKKLCRYLAEITGFPFSPRNLQESIKNSHAVSIKARSIVEKLQGIPGSKHKYGDWLKFLHLEYDRNPEDLFAKMGEFEHQLIPGKDQVHVHRVFLGGNIFYIKEVIDAIEESGFKIVDDSFCFSGRMFKRTFAQEDIARLDMLDEDGLFGLLAKKYVGQFPCYSRNIKNDVINGDDDIYNDIKTSRAKSVIFINIKYCDPNALQYYNLNKLLKKEGIPSLFIEYDCQSATIQQLITRIEAFSELL